MSINSSFIFLAIYSNHKDTMKHAPVWVGTKIELRWALHIVNKAIRDGKYLDLPHSSASGNVPSIKIENFDLSSWRHFSARLSFYIFYWYMHVGLPKRFPYKIFERNCRSDFWNIRHWIVKTRCLLTRHDITYVTLHFYTEYISWPTGSMYTKVCNDSLNATIVI